MRNRCLLFSPAAVVLSVVVLGQALPQPPPTKTKDAPIPFRLPPGFVAERVAAPPLVERPIMAAFDTRGRLFVADNAGRNLKADELLKEKPNLIRVLDDTNADGRFDRSSVFVDQMTFPMGVLWHRDALYSCSPPSLWRFRDERHVGRAKDRRELVTKFGFIGNAADIHGPYLGPDGRLYWTDGRHGHEIRKEDGSTMKGKAARIFRCRADGTEVEVVCGGGMDDPVEMAFTDEGEPLAVVDLFEARPYRVDALIHCIDGGVFPHYEAVLDEFPKTGPLLPPIASLGWVAPSGLMRYRGTAFGAEFSGNLFATFFNTHKVSRIILTREGATFQAKVEDFLVSTDPDFHPTDVLEDADGSLLVLDTGGWFRIGCPTSQTAKPNIMGAIYRIRREGAPAASDPRGNNLDWSKATTAELVARLDDPRPEVRERAIDSLSAHSVNALGATAASHLSEATRRNLVWALCRNDTADARAAVRSYLADTSMSVKLSSVRATGLHRDAEAAPALIGMLGGGHAAVRREAATSLGRIGRREAVPHLLSSLATANDRFLDHALIYALITIGDSTGTARGLSHDSADVQRGALIALDQMAGGKLAAADVIARLSVADRSLRNAAWLVAQRHPEWATEVAGWMRQELKRVSATSDERRASFRDALARSSGSAEVQALIAELIRDPQTPPTSRLLALEAIAEATHPKLPSSWLDALTLAANSPLEAVARQAVITIRSRNVTACDESLRKLAVDGRRQATLRVAAMATVAPRVKTTPSEWFTLLKSQLEAAHPIDRFGAAEALGKLPLTTGQLNDLSTCLPRAGLLELPHLLAAFERSPAVETGRTLVSALERSSSVASLSLQRFDDLLAKFPAEVRDSSADLRRKLASRVGEQHGQLDNLARTLPVGDPERGKAVFYGTKAICTTCHAAQGAGERIGPDLTKIGSVRTPRDLLEAIVAPSASIARGYESTTVTTTDGRTHRGLLRRETAEALYLFTAERAEIRIARSLIETIEPDRVSIMPQGIDTQLTRQELADLIAFLAALK